MIDFRSQLGDAVDGIERHARSQAPMQPCLPACASAQTCAAHLLIAFALLKGIAGAVAVLEKGEAAAGKARSENKGLDIYNKNSIAF